MADLAQQHILTRRRIAGAYDALRHRLRGRPAVVVFGEIAIRIG